MAEHRSAEQVRDDYIIAMGSDLGELQYELYTQLVWLHYKWHQFRSLFGKDADQIQLLNQSAPLFFRIVQDALFDEVLLHVARLTDPPQSVGRDNLTVRRLPALIGDPQLNAEISALLDVVLTSCDFARKRRNQRLAHIDLLTARGAVPLTPASRRDVEVALKALRDLLNRLDGHFRKAQVGYDYVLDHGGAEALVCCLEDGLKAENERRLSLLGRVGDVTE